MTRDNSLALKIENVSKQYRLGVIGAKTFGGEIQRWYKTKILGEEDPLLIVGGENSWNQKTKPDLVWALKDINLEVKKGEVLGLIGKNGAGKSTLLKLLSRITAPTTGTIRTKGKMASLLEVGTGFHPELTGRENIFLNGAILGLTKKEIRERLNNIIDFSGCELYIDTPVKRYSSGMKVRLGFAVAAFLNPDILIVDEVLAVGDAEFQRKAIGKMQDVSKQEGRTVLFVSHNMNSIKQLCSSAVVLAAGKIGFQGEVDSAINYYFDDQRKLSKIEEYRFEGMDLEKPIYLKFAKTKNAVTGISQSHFSVNEQILIDLIFSKQTDLLGVYLHLMIRDEKGTLIIETDSFEHGKNFFDTYEKGDIQMKCILPCRVLKTGSFYVSIGLASDKGHVRQIQSLSEFLRFDVTAQEFPRDAKRQSATSLIPMVEYQWL